MCPTENLYGLRTIILFERNQNWLFLYWKLWEYPYFDIFTKSDLMSFHWSIYCFTFRHSRCWFFYIEYSFLYVYILFTPSPGQAFNAWSAGKKTLSQQLFSFCEVDVTLGHKNVFYINFIQIVSLNFKIFLNGRYGKLTIYPDFASPKDVGNSLTHSILIPCFHSRL